MLIFPYKPLSKPKHGQEMLSKASNYYYEGLRQRVKIGMEGMWRKPSLISPGFGQEILSKACNYHYEGL